ncbi:MAG: nucleotidyltransferase domain-containing protein [Thermomicrobiales bacterium]
MADEAFIERWADRLRREFSDVLAVILKGSYARGEPNRFSDVDFDVLTAGEPREEYPVYFDRAADGRLIHVSIVVQDLDGWLAAGNKSRSWTFGLPSAQASRLLWAADASLRARLDRPYQLHPPAEPELEDFVAELGKIMHARQANDELALRLSARSLAGLCPSVLRPLNPQRRAGTHPEALQLALSLPVAPSGYREDMLTCLGLASRAGSFDEVVQAATRLVAGTIDLLQPHATRIAAELAPGLAEALADGTLRRYVDQVVGNEG